MTLKQKQTIINSILLNEIQKNSLDTNFYSCCRIQYFNSDFLKKIIKNETLPLKLKLIKLITPFISSGFWQNIGNEQDIIIFLDEKNPIPGISLPLTRLLKNTYHELYHAMQDKEINQSNPNITYDLFASKCDQFLCSCADTDLLNYYFSRNNHDSQMFEILANLHGVAKTEEYLQINNIELSESERIELEALKQKYELQYQNYSLTERLDIIFDNYGKCRTYDSFDNTIFSLFVNEDGTVKDINTIFSNENVLNIDPKILLAFIKTNAIKKAISEATLIEKTSYILNELLTNGSTELIQESENKKTI